MSTQAAEDAHWIVSDAISSDRSQSSGAALRLQRWKRLLLRTAKKLRVLPFSNSEAVGDSNDTFLHTAGAFRLALSPQETHAPYGWVRLRLRVQGDVAQLTHLQLDVFGSGVNPNLCTTHLTPSLGADGWIHTAAYLDPKAQQVQLSGYVRSEATLRYSDLQVLQVTRQEVDLEHAWQRGKEELQQPGMWRSGLRQLAGQLRRGDARAAVRLVQRGWHKQQVHDSYKRWLSLYDTCTVDAGLAMAEGIAARADAPRISIVVPVYNTPAEFLEAAIASVEQQLYPHWQLCLVDDASNLPHVREILDAAQARDRRIEVTYRKKNGHISRASNTALEMATGDFVALLDHDDLLAPHALLMVADAILRHADVGLIYSDEDKIGFDGQRCDPYFKPDYSPELLRSQNYISHLGVYRRSLLIELGGFRVGFEGSQDYDLVLRVVERLQPQQIVHIPHVLYHWRLLPGSVAVGPEAKPYAYVAAERALQGHIERTLLPAKVRPAASPGLYHVKFAVPTPAPHVTIIVPSRDNPDMLRRCVHSLRTHTHYPHMDILLVDNDSYTEAGRAAFVSLASFDGVSVMPYPKAFNFSAINNRAVEQARGTLVCLVNDDVEALHGDWLEQMVGFAVRDDIGAVGARLLYPDSRIQHGGVVLGVGGIASHAYRQSDSRAPGYFGRAKLCQNVSAVTAACMLVKKADYLAVGGFDESLAVAYNDVDFCLRLSARGKRHVWTPHATLTHHESASRGIDELHAHGRPEFKREWLDMQQRWRAQIDNDPLYNPNLTRDRDDYSLAFPPKVPLAQALQNIGGPAAQQ